LEWDIADPEEASLFVIEKLDQFNNWIVLTNINAGSNIHHYEFFDESPMKGENIYRLKIITKNNNTIYSSQKRVIIKYDSQFTIYPNPAKDKIIIKGKIDQNTIVRITDITGKEMKKTIINSGVTSCEIFLPPVSPGIYIIHVNNYIEKILILH
jgi:hypothetical protein